MPSSGRPSGSTRAGSSLAGSMMCAAIVPDSVEEIWLARRHVGVIRSQKRSASLT